MLTLQNIYQTTMICEIRKKELTHTTFFSLPVYPSSQVGFFFFSTSLTRAYLALLETPISDLNLNTEAADLLIKNPETYAERDVLSNWLLLAYKLQRENESKELIGKIINVEMRPKSYVSVIYLYVNYSF